MNFVEQATLQVKDQSTAQINRVNRALKQLFATARAGTKIDLGLNIRKGQADIRKLSRDISSLSRGPSRINVNTSAIDAATAKLLRMQSSLRKPVTVRINVAGATTQAQKLLSALTRANVVKLNSSAIDRAIVKANTLQSILSNLKGGVALPTTGGVQPPVANSRTRMSSAGNQGGSRGRIRTGAGIGIAGIGGVGISAPGIALGALTTAAFTAARALSAVATASARRDRSDLLLSVGATKRQADIIRAGAAQPSTGAQALLTETERRNFAQSLLGDVQGTEEQRARAAIKITDALERQVLPRLLALNPDKDRQEIQQGLRGLVKGMNLASSQIVSAAGDLTPEAQRVLNAQMIAMQADPDITPQLINTVLRGLKTSAFTLDERGLAAAFINAGARGQRAGNETEQFINSVLGNQKDEANTNLANLLRRSGNVINEAQVQTDPAAWVREQLLPAIRKEAGLTPTQELTPEKLRPILTSILGRQTAQQAAADLILGDEQTRAAIAQAQMVGQQDISAAVRESWTAQAEIVGARFDDVASRFGTAADKLIGAADKLAGLGSILNGDRTPTAGEAAVGAGVTLAGGLLLKGALSRIVAPFKTFFGAAARSAARSAAGGATARGVAGRAAAGAAGTVAGRAGMGLLGRAGVVGGLLEASKLALDAARETPQGQELDQKVILPFLRDVFKAARESDRLTRVAVAAKRERTPLQQAIDAAGTGGRIVNGMREGEQITIPSAIIEKVDLDARAIQFALREDMARQAADTNERRRMMQTATRPVAEAAGGTPPVAKSALQQVQTITSDSIIIRNAPQIREQDAAIANQMRELAASIALTLPAIKTVVGNRPGPSIEDRATRERGEGTTIDRMLRGMDKVTVGTLNVGNITGERQPATGGPPSLGFADIIGGGQTMVDSFAGTFKASIDAGNAALGATNDRFAATFLSGSSQLGTSGTTFGTNARSTLNAAGEGAAFGQAAAAAINAAVANIRVNVEAQVRASVNRVGTGVDAGAQNPVE